MKIKTKEWIIFILIAFLCFGFWYKLEYPHFTFLNLSIDKQKALSAADDYLKSKSIDTGEYSKAIIFDVDDWFNRYLQRTLGVKGEENFIRQYDYDLFFWKIRFFKELQKEEYIVKVSPHSGSILGYKHLIEDIESREDIGKNIARQKAEEFLKNNYAFDVATYDFHEEKTKRYEKRTDYVFSWEKKGVYIPWKKDQGTAKLLTGVTVSGDEIREYYKNRLEVPENFQRYVENQLILGRYLYNFYFILLVILIMFSVNIVIKRRYNVTARPIKKWFCYLAAFVAIINVVDVFNGLGDVIMEYPTSAQIASFIGLHLTRTTLNITLLFIAFIMPAIAGELLANEVLPKDKRNFLHYIRANFFNRSISKAIILGYTIAIITLGLQAIIFYLGQKTLGVWREWFKLTQFSSVYIPLFSVFTVSITASLNEEITFRLFGISLTKKFFKNTITAVVLTSILWGLGHTAYAIFPVWFRVIEVSFIGFLFGFIFLRYGIIPLIVAHYLFDVFWGSAAYILGRSQTSLFFGSILVLALPLIFAIIAYLANRGDKERDIKTMLDKIQEYNLGILITFMSTKKSQGVSPDIVKEELIQHNWDPSLIDIALKEVF
ncbi:MAG: type II CAAX endopeptidase family protein [Candidatus Omnitrophota bacterium]|nr:type II CAAX endopeptidase family protein [Candidatus Omnitrophota bacterium]